MRKSVVILLAGPTASGKSDICSELANRLNAEIISVDALQVYKGLDIGTAKPSIEEMRRVQYHLVDIINPWERFSVGQFIELAKDSFQKIVSNKKDVIFCGGSGLYFKAILDGIDTVGEPNPSLRKELEKLTLEQMLQELKIKDYQTYERIDKNNPRRVMRAVEILRSKNIKPSELRQCWVNGKKGFLQENYTFICLKRDPIDLRQRINNRVDSMISKGWIDEVKNLLSLGISPDSTSLQAIGYKEIVEYLQGKMTLEKTIEIIKIKTWRYAKRQLTWFKYKLSPIWLFVERNESPEVTAQRILELSSDNFCNSK